MTHARITTLGIALVAATTAACTGASGRPAARAPQAVDSAIPLDSALALFRHNIGEPAGFTNGAESRDALVERFITLLEAANTTQLQRLVLTKAEFAYLYYPWVPESQPPYDLSPSLMWFMLHGGSSRGLSVALDERGGEPQDIVGYECPEAPRRYGDYTVWPLCLLRRVQAPGDTVVERFFGPIVERDGRFKFVSLANKLG